MIQMHELMDRSLQDIRNRYVFIGSFDVASYNKADLMMSGSYKSLFRLCSRSNAPPFIPSTANLGIIDHIHDLSPMPSYEMFSQNSPHYTPNDITTFVAEDPSASTCCTTPTADDSTSANGEIICYENIDEFCRLWSHLDSTTDFESPIQWNDQQNNVSLPIAESTDSTHNSTTGHIEVVFNNSAWFGDKHNT